MQVQAKEIVLVPLNEIKLNPKNRNTHSPEQIAQLVKILKYQGFRNPGVISNQSGLLAAGEGRYLALKEVGATHMPVTYQDFEDSEQEYLYGVSDNEIAKQAVADLPKIHLDLQSMGPFDIELLGLRDFQFEPDPEQGDPDAAPEAPKVAKTKRGELWILGDHRLLIDDSTEKENVERLMGTEKADLLFSSPPYSDQRDYEGQIILDPKHLAKCLLWPATVLVLNLGLQKKNHEIFPYWNDYLDFAKSKGLKLLSWNVWDKQACGSVGHQTAMFPMEHEWIFVWGEPRKLNKTEENKWANTISTGNSQRERDGSITRRDDIHVGTHRPVGTVLRMPPHKARNLEIDHPAIFPVSFPEKYIEAVTQPGATVAEPFSGSGSTLIACEKTKRRCFGMEIEPLYGDVILTRWAKFTGKDPVREDGVNWSELNG